MLETLRKRFFPTKKEKEDKATQAEIIKYNTYLDTLQEHHQKIIDWSEKQRNPNSRVMLLHLYNAYNIFDCKCKNCGNPYQSNLRAWLDDCGWCDKKEGYIGMVFAPQMSIPGFVNDHPFPIPERLTHA